MLYHFPEQLGTRNYLFNVDVDDLDIAEESYANERPAMGCDDNFAELANMVMEDHNYNTPNNEREARSLYINFIY